MATAARPKKENTCNMVTKCDKHLASMSICGSTLHMSSPFCFFFGVCTPISLAILFGFLSLPLETTGCSRK